MESVKYIVTLIIGILIGMILGICIYNLFISYKIDGYYNKISVLEGTLEEKDTQLKKLEKSINNKNYILKNIEILFTAEDEELDYIYIEKVIQEKYSELLGKEIKNIDGDMVAKVIEGRIMRLDEKIYQIKINKLILSETMKIWLEVKEIN